MIDSIEKLRESSHLDDSKWTLETGEVIHVYGSEPNDPNAVNWGERWRKIADEIEAEIESRYMPRPCDMDGVPVKIGDELSHDGFARNFIVHSYELTDGAWSVWDVANGATHLCQACRHVTQRTIEDVLREFVEYVTNGTNVDSYEKDIADYADEIRELMEVDR